MFEEDVESSFRWISWFGLGLWLGIHVCFITVSSAAHHVQIRTLLIVKQVARVGLGLELLCNLPCGLHGTLMVWRIEEGDDHDRQDRIRAMADFLRLCNGLLNTSLFSQVDRIL